MLKKYYNDKETGRSNKKGWGKLEFKLWFHYFDLSSLWFLIVFFPWNFNDEHV